jgi:hypothetical protein
MSTDPVTTRQCERCFLSPAPTHLHVTWGTRNEHHVDLCPSCEEELYNWLYRQSLRSRQFTAQQEATDTGRTGRWHLHQARAHLAALFGFRPL